MMNQRSRIAFGLTVLSTVFAAACASPVDPDAGDTGADETTAVDVPGRDVPNRPDVPTRRDVPDQDIPNATSDANDVPNPPTEDATDVVVPPVDAIDVPNVDVPNRDVPNGLDVPNFDVPNVDVPNFDVPNRDVPNGLDVPNFDVPTDVPCPPNTRVFGGRCVGIGAARPIAPISLGNSTLRQPTFKWAFPSGFDGATVEICRDRACTMIIERFTAVGTSGRPANALPAASTIYWRVRGRVGATEDPTNSATWLFHTPRVDATAGVDSSANPHVDFNGDGIDDVVFGTPRADPGGVVNAGSVTIYMGSLAGLPAAPTRTIAGAAAGDAFGYSVAGGGDLNGDGYGDLVVGARLASSAGTLNCGTVTVYQGGPTGVAANPTSVISGDVTNDFFGFSVSSAGDINGDGYAEIVVGALNASPGGMRAAGTASVFHGSQNGIGITPTIVLAGVAMADGFGLSVAHAGDVNGDGLSDLVVGARLASPGGRVNAGTASVFYGRVAGLTAMPSVVLEGLAAGDYTGNSVSSAGDVNNDGFSDLIIGAYNSAPGGRAAAGATHIYHGAMGGVSPMPVRTLTGGAAGDAFGDSVSLIGDVNGDGFGDVVIGAYAADPGGVSNAGTGSVYHGSAGGIAAAPATVIPGTSVSNFIGYSVAGLGDVNGDSFSDFALGGIGAAPGGRAVAGIANIYHGSAMGTVLPAARVYEGVAANDEFGHSIAQLTPTRARRRTNRANTHVNPVVVPVVRLSATSSRPRG